MYRTNDPRFRRRLNEIGQTLEHANESAQSGIYIFGQTYVKPCFESVSSCFTDCVDAGCPSLNLRNRDRIRRQRGQTRSRGRAELSFDFYDDWDEDENDGLLGWGNDDFDRLLAGGGGYGTVTNTQPARQHGMSYPKARRKSAHDIEAGPTVVPGSSGFFGRMFGARPLRYKPSAAGLQEHPGARRLDRDMTEGEALLEESEASEAGGQRRQSTRNRSGTAGSRETQSSFSSRGDIFPSDDEDDAVPIDDEFAMVLERRTTTPGSGSGPETETEASSDKTRDNRTRRGKRPSASTRGSSRRTVSSRSAKSATSTAHSRASSYAALTAKNLQSSSSPSEEVSTHEVRVATLTELEQENARVAAEEEAAVAKKRLDAQMLAEQKGLSEEAGETDDAHATRSQPDISSGEPSQLPTPVPTDDEAEEQNTTPEEDACNVD